MRRHILIFISTILLSACASSQQDAVQIRNFDFGPDPATPTATAAARGTVKIPVILHVADISAPEWLDSTTIKYRLAYREPLSVLTYSTSRWVAPPSSQLTGRLKNALAGGAGVAGTTDIIRTGCVLRISLEDFSQIFDSAAASHVSIRARASLAINESKKLLAQKTVVIERPTATADINGAVAGLATGGDALVSEIVKWLAATFDAGTVTGQAAINQCKLS